MKVMSFNIRNACDTGTEAWNVRRPRLSELVRSCDCDIMGFQEVLHSQLLDLGADFPEYGYVGIGRDDGQTLGEYAAIFYRKDRIELIDSSYFWLSQTPDRPSLGWDAACIRICSCAEMKDKASGRKFRHFNTHLDHVGTEAMYEGVNLISSAMLDSDLPAIATGDFNVGESSRSYRTMIESGLLDAKYIAAQTMSYGTFHGYEPSPAMADESPIDYLFVTPNDFTVQSYKVIVNGCKGEYTSDHYPIVADLDMI